MGALFVALSILVLALLTLLLWFVPHLLQQQATKVAGETSQLRDMLLDLLNEQEAVTLRQAQLGNSLTRLQQKIEDMLADGGRFTNQVVPQADIAHLEGRFSELQNQLQQWAHHRSSDHNRRSQDNEAWAYLLSLLGTIQDRLGNLSQQRAGTAANVQAVNMLEELEQEMQNLRGISEDIASLQQRLRRSLDQRETSVTTMRTRVPGATPAQGNPTVRLET
jgi:chromosome segregation ATPase